MDNTATAIADPAESSSLSDHEQSYHAPSLPGETPSPAPVVTERHDDGVDPPESETVEQKTERARDEATGQFKKEKHRAKSQQASKDDVEQINAYTRRIREAEERLGIKVERKEGESERVYQLRRRAELLEAKREAARVEPPAPPIRPVPKAPEPFKEPKPKYEDFANEEDQYQAHLLAVARWERRKEAAEGAIEQHKTANYEAIKERNERREQWFKAKESEHLDRMAKFHESNPEAQAILDAAGDVHLTPAIYAAVMTAENSPELLILVAQNEDLRDDLTILTEGKPLNKDLVALVQRRLNRGLTAGTTGAAPVPAQPVKAVPRPPTPVRTAPMKTTDAPPGDDSSLSAHESAYYKRGRR